MRQYYLIIAQFFHYYMFQQTINNWPTSQNSCYSQQNSKFWKAEIKQFQQ